MARSDIVILIYFLIYILCCIFSYMAYSLGHDFIKIIFEIKKHKLDWYNRQLYLCFMPIINIFVMLYIVSQLYMSAKTYIKHHM